MSTLRGDIAMPATCRKVMILGCTGSIGSSALKGLHDQPDHYKITALSAHDDLPGLLRIARERHVSTVCLSGKTSVPQSDITAMGFYGKLYCGREGLLAMIRETEADIVLNGIAGSAGLEPSFAVIESGKDLALANKESVVMAGLLLLQTAREHRSTIIPVDSEHAAIAALLEAHGRSGAASLVLTASGGPFKDTDPALFETITVEQALLHPTWKMGAKISIDSATMANKGLEIMEASILFGFDESDIEVVVHPQSIVHSMLRMNDGAVYAQLSIPDMTHPIMRALGTGLVLKDVIRPLDFSQLRLTFDQPDPRRFPMLALARACLKQGQAAMIAFNAANEVAVDAFIQRTISFAAISSIVREVLEHDRPADCPSLNQIFAIDRLAREQARQVLTGKPGPVSHR